MRPGRLLRYRFEEGVVRTVAALLRRLPEETALSLGGRVGGWVYARLGFRRGVVGANLSATIGADWSRRERDGLGRQAYANLGRSLVEYCRLPVLQSDDIERNVVVEGRDFLDEALAPGRGVVLVSGHFGSWQLLGACLRQLGYPTNYVAVPQRNPFVHRIQEEIADVVGTPLLPPGRGARGMLRALERNEIVAILADQNAGEKGLFIDFLGRPASTARGPAELALRAGSPIVAAFLTRTDGPRHRLCFQPPVWGNAAKGDRTEEVHRLTRAHVEALEEVIRRHPEQWLWGHRRWRARPPH